MGTKIRTKKHIFPLIPNFTATTVLRAFLLNALVIAAISTITIEMRLILDERKNDVYSFLHQWLLGDNKSLNFTERQKLIVVFITAFISAILVYHIMLALFGYGRGMLVASSQAPYV